MSFGLEEFLKVPLIMHCDRCNTLSKCNHDEGSRYLCVDQEECYRRQSLPIVHRAKELGIKLTTCKTENCKELVGYTNIASLDRSKLIRQGRCTFHQTGLVGYGTKKLINHNTEEGYRKGCRDHCCLSAHAEKISRDRKLSSGLKRIPEVHEIESILDKIKNPDYIPNNAEIYAVKIFMERFPQFFNKSN